MALSPMMSHYLQMKEKYKDCILFYRLGDFYEMFFDDAVEASKALDLYLTGRDCGLEERAPMCGIPFHAADTYIAKLISQGYKVAICEQLSEPQKGKMVERDVLRVITPGTVVEDNLLDEKSNNYIVSIYKDNNDSYGVCCADVSTGDFFTFETTTDNNESVLNDFLDRINPSEVIVNERAKESYIELPSYKMNSLVKPFVYYDWAYSLQSATQTLKKQFGLTCLTIYELSSHPYSISACGAMIEYLLETQKRSISHIRKINKIENNDYMVLDSNTRRNLELTETIREHKKRGSLLYLLDTTKTSIGARMFRKWFNEPLKNEKEIILRLDAVDEFVKKLPLREKLISILSRIYDIERISSKIALGTISPKDCQTLAMSLENIPSLKECLSTCASKKLVGFYSNIADFSSVVSLINSCISDDIPAQLKDGGYIRPGYNLQLDDYRNAKHDATRWLADIEAREREATGIKNLRISYNKVFGYFIEINKSQIQNVPLNYVRKQTVANNERYITEELKEIEEKVLGSDENAIKLEQALFLEIKQGLQNIVPDLQDISKIIGEIDCLCSFATDAIKNNYVKPKVSKSIDRILIEEGRHPVVESLLKDEQFIPNDTTLNSTTDKIMIITGPNMAGKSTYMRQVAVLTFMAHIGCFVPAKKAEFSIVDRIFTRVGASDDLAFGQSTFMVEMTEVATILANATKDSLIILDEIGRGTSTFDGLAIAWSVVEALSNNYKSKTLFATHYHELTELEGILEGVKNYRISIKEFNNSIVFLRKIVRGGANKSFGIEVASLAGLPVPVIDRAKLICHNLEESDLNKDLSLNKVINQNIEKTTIDNKISQEIVAILKDVKIEKMTPLDAFDLITTLSNKLKKD